MWRKAVSSFRQMLISEERLIQVSTSGNRPRVLKGIGSPTSDILAGRLMWRVCKSTTGQTCYNSWHVLKGEEFFRAPRAYTTQTTRQHAATSRGHSVRQYVGGHASLYVAERQQCLCEHSHLGANRGRAELRVNQADQLYRIP